MLKLNKEPIKFFLQLLFLTVFSLAQLGCDNTSSSGSSSSGKVAGVKPVTSLKISSISTVEYFGNQLTLTVRSGSEGDFEVLAEDDSDVFESAMPTIQVANRVSSINVVDVQRIQAADFSCEDGTRIKASRSSSYLTGVVSSVGDVNGKNLTCTSTFLTVLPTTITGTASTTGLLAGWGADDDKSKIIEETGLTSTTCPQGENDDFDSVNPFTKSCSGDLLTNYTVTDDNGGVHKLSTKISFTGSARPATFPIIVPSGGFTPMEIPSGGFDPVVIPSGPFAPVNIPASDFSPIRIPTGG